MQSAGKILGRRNASVQRIARVSRLPIVLLVILGWPEMLLAATGNLLWATRAGSGFSERSYGIAVDGSGNSYITGTFKDTTTFGAGANQTILTSVGGNIVTEVFVAKYNAAGVFQWAKSVGGIGNDSGNAIAVDAVGNSYVTGSFEGTATFGAGEANQTILNASTPCKVALNCQSDIFIAKYDATGLLQWAKPRAESLLIPATVSPSMYPVTFT